MTVLEFAPRPMGRALTPVMSEWFAAAHRHEGSTCVSAKASATSSPARMAASAAAVDHQGRHILLIWSSSASACSPTTTLPPEPDSKPATASWSMKRCAQLTLRFSNRRLRQFPEYLYADQDLGSSRSRMLQRMLARWHTSFSGQHTPTKRHHGSGLHKGHYACRWQACPAPLTRPHSSVTRRQPSSPCCASGTASLQPWNR